MKIEWNSCFKIGVSLFLLYLCITYWSSVANLAGLLFGAAMPLLIGFGIAYLVNILMSFYEKHYFIKRSSRIALKSRRPVCMIAAFFTLIAVVLLIIRLILPQLWSCVEMILSKDSGIFQKMVELVDKYHILPENIVESLEAVDWTTKIGQVIQVLTSGIGSVVDVLITAVSSVFSWVVSALLSVIFAVYLLAEKEKLIGQLHKLLHRYAKEKQVKRLNYVLGIFNSCFRSFIVGQCIEAVIIGVLCTIGMLIFRFPYATMIGALIGFTALIPVAGAYIGAIVGALMILSVSPIKALLFLIFIIVLQQLEDNIVYPKVVGSSIGLPGIWVLAAITVGGGVMGIAGMLLGVPLFAAAYRLLKDDVNGTRSC